MNTLLYVFSRQSQQRVFEVATQFNAIFRAQTKSSDTSVSLLSMWMARRVNAFLTLLSSELDLVEDSASLRDALEASIFFANSMGRLGADFTAQLANIFEPRMHQLVLALWKQGVEQLRETLRVCREAGVASPLVSHTAESSTPAEDVFSALSTMPLDGPQAPPRQLLALPPLARLVNAVLTGLNELRRCLLPGIFAQLRTSLEQDVIDVVKAELLKHERAVLKPGLRGDAAQLREVAARFKSVFPEVVEPYLKGSLEAAIGNKQAAQCLHQIYVESLKTSEPEMAEDSPNDAIESSTGSPEAEEEIASESPAADADTKANDREVEPELSESGDAAALGGHTMT